MTSRAMYPFELSKAIEQFGRGDLAVRAHIRGGAEARALAAAFNTMADRMEQYRRSSLGEMLYTQLAAQAVLNSLPDPVFVFDLDGDILTLNPAAEKLLSPRRRQHAERFRGLDPHLRGRRGYPPLARPPREGCGLADELRRRGPPAATRRRAALPTARGAGT